MSDLITLQQLTDRLGPLDADDATKAPSLIEDASWLVRDIVHDDDVTDAWDAAVAGSIPGGIVPIVVAMVRRSLLNPDGLESESQMGYTYRGASTAGVFATRREVAAIQRAVRRGSPRVFDLSADLPLHPRHGIGLS